jgi:spore coat polysaccharide biosynthesis protein SpsF
MKKIAIVQARVGSTRLPGKIFAEISGAPLVWHVYNRLTNAKNIDKIVFAIPDTQPNDELADYLEKNKIALYRGDEDNVLARFYSAATEYKADIVIRITADDPFKDPDIIDKTVTLLLENDLDFAYNNKPPTFPEGLDVEVFTYKALRRAAQEAETDFDKEHVTQYMFKNPSKFKQLNFANNEDMSHLRWTIDQAEDLEMAREVYKELYTKISIFKIADILSLLKRKPQIARMNTNVKRSTMYIKS